MTANIKGLSGKVAFVTGGSRGIGEGIVRRLASEGAAVAFTFASSSSKAERLVSEIEANGGKALALRADSQDVSAIKNAVADAITTLGNIKILVNNAGIFDAKPYDQFSMDEFDRMVAVNIRAVFAAVQAAAPSMGQGDRIITIGSVNGDVTGFPGLSLYSMTKSAVAGMTRGLARDLGPKGVTVNNIQPGPVDTDMNPADGPDASSMRSLMALGRHGTTSEIAGLVAYLASSEAAYITGASIDINGGFMI
jgi:3-oxoacyl-[acyl-carrier protein] reductase